MTSSKPAHLAQDFGLIQAHSRSRKQLGSELKGPSHLFLLVIDDMIIISEIFAKIMSKLVFVGAENQHSQLFSSSGARKL